MAEAAAIRVVLLVSSLAMLVLINLLERRRKRHATDLTAGTGFRTRPGPGGSGSRPRRADRNWLSPMLGLWSWCTGERVTKRARRPTGVLGQT